RYERAQVQQWMFFEQYSHEPNIATARFKRHAGIEMSAGEWESRRRGGEAALAAIETHLADRSWLVGSRYSVADIALYAYTHVAPEGGFPLAPFPAIRAWMDRVAAEPHHVTITDADL